MLNCSTDYMLHLALVCAAEYAPSSNQYIVPRDQTCFLLIPSGMSLAGALMLACFVA